MKKVGPIVSIDGTTYRRKQPGINLSTDFLTDEEIASLSGEVTVYRKRKKSIEYTN